MMLVPRNSFNLFDDFFNDEFFREPKKALMKTDIKEKKDKYVIDIDLPGFKKENISVSLNNGYLEISAKVDKEDNSDDDERVVRRERFYGECSRSFYVGDQITEEDIEAQFKNGVLKLEIPKKDETEKEPDKKQIEIK